MFHAKSFAQNAVAALLALAAGCGGSSSSGRVTVMLTGAAAPFSAAVVTITKVTLIGTAGETTLSTKATTTNLLTLANDAQSLVQDAVVQAGTYTELRFYISGGYVQVPGATAGTSEIYASSPTYEGLPAGAQVTGTLKMPSLAQSGLKVDFGSDLKLGTDAKILLVDFDGPARDRPQPAGTAHWLVRLISVAQRDGLQDLRERGVGISAQLFIGAILDRVRHQDVRRCKPQRL